MSQKTQAKETESYQAIQAQLDEVLARLQAPDVQVDEAVKLYEAGLALADRLERYVREAENRITELTLQTGKPAAL